jgi:hypothetical protein
MKKFWRQAVQQCDVFNANELYSCGGKDVA